MFSEGGDIDEIGNGYEVLERSGVVVKMGEDVGTTVGIIMVEGVCAVSLGS